MDKGEDSRFAEAMTGGNGCPERLMMRLAATFLRLSEAASAKLRTTEARGQATLSDDVRVLAGGRIMNIFGDPANVRIGSHARLRGEILTFAHAGRITIGSWFYLGPGSMIWSSDKVGIKIGDRVLVSANVTIHDTDSHPIAPKTRFAQTKEIFGSGHPKAISEIGSAPIIIGDDAWIGAGAVILKGVSIGDAAIIGAGSIVTQDVPSNSIVAGNPARQVGRVDD